MSTESLASMTLQELRYERKLAQQNTIAILASMVGKRGQEKWELDDAVIENRRYIETINARIARLEHRERKGI